jgi:hypothetical protein
MGLISRMRRHAIRAGWAGGKRPLAH